MRRTLLFIAGIGGGAGCCLVAPVSVSATTASAQPGGHHRAPARPPTRGGMLARLAAARRAALQAQRSVPSQCRRGLSAKPTMALIKELREQTGAPIVDVKAALV